MLLKRSQNNADQAYEKYSRGLREFLARIRDYCSLIMLIDEVTTEIHPSINLISISLCLDFEYRESSTISVNDKNAPIKDTSVNNVISKGL